VVWLCAYCSRTRTLTRLLRWMQGNYIYKGSTSEARTFYQRVERHTFPSYNLDVLSVSCGRSKMRNEGLNIADRQNAHSSSVAVKQVVDLYRKVSRQHELNRKILSFSISHDQEAARIYGHYPVIDGGQTSVDRHTIKKFDITSETGKDKWTTYIFTRNLYDIYGPMHFERLRSAVDQLPSPLSDQHRSQQSDLEVLY
jgi:hypothetical protein